jgi:hypothetical protein
MEAFRIMSNHYRHLNSSPWLGKSQQLFCNVSTDVPLLNCVGGDHRIVFKIIEPVRNSLEKIEPIQY